MNTTITVKTRAVSPDAIETEVEIARKKFLTTYDAYVKQKTIVNRKAVLDALKEWNELKKLYRDGERVVNVRVLSGQKRRLPWWSL